MTPFKFGLGQLVNRVGDRSAWLLGSAGMVVARAATEHLGLGCRNEYFVNWPCGSRTWHAEPELCCLESEKPIDKP